MENLDHYYKLVEDVITKLGVDPANCRGERAGQWNLRKGSADVWVDVWETPEKYGYIQIMAPIVEIPTNNQLEFFQEVLEINHKLYGVGFTKYNNWIYIKGIRELEDLSGDEIMAMFNRVGYYADDYDDYFKQKYHEGGNRPPQN